MKKNKYSMILMFLGILIILLLILFLSTKEGMDNDCTYQYLSPNQTNAPLDDATINDFMTKYDYHMDQIGAKIKLDRTTFDSWMKMKVFCPEEIKFYIKNNYFPINHYILNELSAKEVKPLLPPPFDSSTIAFGYSARMIFYQFVIPSYGKGRPKQKWIVEAMNIYNGKTPEPSCSSPPTPINAPAGAAPTVSLPE